MKWLQSVVDGFQIILGSYLTQFTAALTLVFFIRPPEYEGNEQRTKEALRLYVILIFWHVWLTLVIWSNFWYTKFFQDKLTIFMICQLLLACYICENWVYDVDLQLKEDKTAKAIKFECWIDIEFVLMCSYILGGVTYAICNKIWKLSLRFTREGEDELEFGDYIEVNMFLIDISNNMFAPALVGIVLGMTDLEYQMSGLEIV